MARQKPKVDPRDIVPPTGELQLPDVASFDTDKPQPSAPKGNRQPGRVVGLGTGDRIGVDHERALFSFADLRAQLLRLAVGHPDRGGETFGCRLRPEHQDVDAGIRLAVMT